MSVASRLKIVATVVLTLSNLAACHFQAGVKDSTGGAGTISTGVGGIGGVATAGTTGTLGAAGSLGLPPTMTMPAVNCVGLQCQQSTCVTGNCTVTCPMGQRTTISGTIWRDCKKQPPASRCAVAAPGAKASRSKGHEKWIDLSLTSPSRGARRIPCRAR